MLYGLTEYDDGVYYASAMHLVAGQLPYRAFTLVQPPGITLLLSPIAALTGAGDSRLGLAIARVLTGVVTGANALLLVWILRRRALLAALLAGTLLAIYPPAVLSDRTLMLEPYLLLFCLLAIALAFENGVFASNRRLLAAGIALGFAGTIKLFAASVALAFGIVLLARYRDRLRPLATGALIGFGLPSLPFFLAAPHAFIHDIFIAQLARSTAAAVPFVTRFDSLVGLTQVANGHTLPLGPHSIWPVVAGILLVLVTFGGTIWLTLRRRVTPMTWFALLAALASFGMVLLPRQFYVHYDLLAAAMSILSVGCVTGDLFHAGTPESARSQTRQRQTMRLCVALASVIFIVVGASIVVRAQVTLEEPVLAHYGDPGRSIDSAIPKGACVVSEASSLLVIANRVDLSSNCPAMVDSTGTWLAIAPAYPPRRNRTEPKNAVLVAEWRAIFSKAQYAVFAGKNAFRVPFTPALSTWFNDRFVRIPGVAPISFVRRPHPVSNAPNIRGVVP